jgi:hypothetical protein
MAKKILVIDQPDGGLPQNVVTVSGTGVTLADTNTAQTMTNKTFTAPVIVNATVTTSNSTIDVQTLAGAGTNAATAGAITVKSPGFVFATGGNNSVGIILPVAFAGARITVKNDDAANGIMKVYPQVNSSINGTANSALSMAANTQAEFFALNGTAWFTNKVPC